MRLSLISSGITQTRIMQQYPFRLSLISLSVQAQPRRRVIFDMSNAEVVVLERQIIRQGDWQEVQW